MYIYIRRAPRHTDSNTFREEQCRAMQGGRTHPEGEQVFRDAVQVGAGVPRSSQRYLGF